MGLLVEFAGEKLREQTGKPSGEGPGALTVSESCGAWMW